MKHTLLSKLLSVILSLCVLLCMVPVMGLLVSALDATLDTDGTTILISTAEQLAAIGVDANYPRDGQYKLTNDIDLSNFDSDTNPDNGNWTPLCGNYALSWGNDAKAAAFTGTFDGQGYTIKGMEINYVNTLDVFYANVNAGLFAFMTDKAVFKNTVFEDCHIDVRVGTTAYAGFVVGNLNDGNYVTVENVYITNSSIYGTSK